MRSFSCTKLFVVAWAATSLLLVPNLGHAQAQPEIQSHEPTDVIVMVKEADTGEPVSQARVTLQFTVPGPPSMPWKAKKISYNAKTDTQGRCKLLEINKGTIVLSVTAPGHQSYGKELHFEKDHQVFDVKLKKPQPLI